MAKNIFKSLATEAHLNREGFDLSHRETFGVNFGELIPALFTETIPGDHIRMNVTDFVRAMPMVTAPFIRATQHLDFYFVPYTQLWTHFNEYIEHKDEPHSAYTNSSLYCPVVSGDLLNYVTDTANEEFDIHTISSAFGARRLLDMMQYGSRYFNQVNAVQGATILEPTWPDTKYFNLWRILAYNKIWYDFYRQKYYDDGMNILDNAPQYTAAALFNVDDLDCSTVAGSKLDNVTNSGYRFQAMLQMRYRTWKKDLFTGLLPSTQYGSVSAITGTSTVSHLSDYAVGASGNNILYGRSTDGRIGRLKIDSVPTDVSGNISSTGFTDLVGSSSFDILAFRQANAIQKYREALLRAGNRVSDAQNTRFGVRPRFDTDSHPLLLGSVSGRLNISDVDSTAASPSLNVSNANVGDIAGKGTMAFDGHGFDFDCSDYGVIVGIYSILPESDYNSGGVHRNNCLVEREDYYTPEFQNLGFEAVDVENAMVFKFGTSPALSGTLGYAPRYWNYKQEVDHLHGMFQNTSYLGGDYRIWSAPRDNQAGQYSNIVSLSDLYVNYMNFDNNFYEYPSQNDESDMITESYNFMTTLYADCQALRPLSVLGLPQI